MDQMATLKLDQHELMCRIIEAISGEERPAGRTPRDLVLNMVDDETFENTELISRVVIQYVLEQQADILGIGSTKH